jgi:Prp8 binding protein
MSIRKSPPPGPGLAVQKRARVDDEEDESMQTLTVSASNAEGKGALVRSIKRTSGLQNPIMSLGGAHSVRRSSSAWTCQRSSQNLFPGDLQGEIISCRFDSTGQIIAACSADKNICR